MMLQMTKLNMNFDKHIYETIRLTKTMLLMQNMNQLNDEDQAAALVVKTTIKAKYKL